MNKKNQKYNKALIIDSSGLRPWFFAMKEKDMASDILDNFLQKIEVDYFLSSKAQHEFLSTGYTSQLSIFILPFNIDCIQKYDAVYLSDAGYLSTTANSRSQLRFFNSGTRQPNLWETSKVWSRLSEEDRSVIQTANDLMEQYSSVAILTNDWDLRQHSTFYEGIEARGTCSMLASLALDGYISYQRGTYIFEKWLIEEPRWIPNFSPERRKFTFREVLETERQRRLESKSFWSLTNKNNFTTQKVKFRF